MINLYLIDADETLLDFDMAEKTAFSMTANAYGLNSSPALLERYRKIKHRLSNSAEQQTTDRETLMAKRFELLFEESGIVQDSTAFNNQYLCFLSQQGQLIPGALHVCRQLAKRAPIGIVTNGIASSQRKRLTVSGIMPWIRYVIISEEAGAQKPAAAFFKYALQQANHPSTAGVLMVGDSISTDMEGAKNYGLKTCLFDPKNRHADYPADYRIQQLQQLLDIHPT